MPHTTNGLPVPPEIVHAIALELVALAPLGPPTPLLPLLLTSKALYAALSPAHNPNLAARIFRLKFDAGPVARRAFVPAARDYADQLAASCAVLRSLRTRDVWAVDAEETLWAAYVMMLENDGKNRAQLEWAGVELYVELYARTRIYETRSQFAGWPEESTANSCALWLMWMFTTREKLLSETHPQREHLISIVLPFVLVPYRYPSALAPPHHFTLPLPPSSSYSHATHPTTPLPFSIPTAHGSYPLYLRPSRDLNAFHFAARPSMAPPLITVAAKLLYFSRREIIPFGIPPHLPIDRADAERRGRGDGAPTQADMREVNRWKGARLPRRVVWDWNLGKAVRGRLEDDPEDETRQTGEEEEASRAWDCEWWRLRMCGDAWREQPKWRPGRVYVPGCMSGLWQGRLLIPSEHSATALLLTEGYPPGFSEAAQMVTTQPLFMRLREHFGLVGAQHVPAPTASVSYAVRGRSNDPTPREDGEEEEDHDHDEDREVEVELGMRNAWFPGRPGGVSWSSDVCSPSPPFSYSRQQCLHAHQRDLIRLRTDYDSYGPGWVYETFDPAKRSSHDVEECVRCAEIERVKERVRKEEWERVERVWEGVGLGFASSSKTSSSSMGSSSSLNTTGEEDEEEEDDPDAVYPFDLDLDLEMEGDDLPDGEPTWGRDELRTRRTHEKGKVPDCDGVEDVLFTGSTDDRHAKAWNHYTFYGRVRPWDGLIGILRMARYPSVNHVFFYGYLVGGQNFVGNWRVAGADPIMPAWESAFTMSKRRDG